MPGLSAFVDVRWRSSVSASGCIVNVSASGGGFSNGGDEVGNRLASFAAVEKLCAASPVE